MVAAVAVVVVVVVVVYMNFYPLIQVQSFKN
jgi:hypothetical protein